VKLATVGVVAGVAAEETASGGWGIKRLIKWILE